MRLGAEEDGCPRGWGRRTGVDGVRRGIVVAGSPGRCKDCECRCCRPARVGVDSVHQLCDGPRPQVVLDGLPVQVHSGEADDLAVIADLGIGLLEARPEDLVDFVGFLGSVPDGRRKIEMLLDLQNVKSRHFNSTSRCRRRDVEELP